MPAGSCLPLSSPRGFSPWTWPYFNLATLSSSLECCTHTCTDRNQWIAVFLTLTPALRHDDFVAEAPGRDGQQCCAKNAKSEAICPKMNQGRAAQDDAARNVNEIRRWNEVAERIENGGYRLTGKDIAREKNTGKNRKKRQLHGFCLGRGFARNQDSQR